MIKTKLIETRKTSDELKFIKYELTTNSNGYGCKIQKLKPQKNLELFISHFINEFTQKCNKFMEECAEKQPRILLKLLADEIKIQFAHLQTKPAIGFESLKYWLKNGIGMKVSDPVFNNIFKWNLLEQGFKTLLCSKRIRSEKIIIIQDLWEYRLSI